MPNTKPRLTVTQRHATDSRTDPPVKRTYPELRISAPFLDAAGIKPGDRVTVETAPGKVTLRKERTGG